VLRRAVDRAAQVERRRPAAVGLGDLDSLSSSAARSLLGPISAQPEHGVASRRSG
jgi:hypothetical protein